jgi:hypothetical protein
METRSPDKGLRIKPMSWGNATSNPNEKSTAVDTDIISSISKNTPISLEVPGSCVLLATQKRTNAQM